MKFGNCLQTRAQGLQLCSAYCSPRYKPTCLLLLAPIHQSVNSQRYCFELCCILVAVKSAALVHNFWEGFLRCSLQHFLLEMDGTAKGWGHWCSVFSRRERICGSFQQTVSQWLSPLCNWTSPWCPGKLQPISARDAPSEIDSCVSKNDTFWLPRHKGTIVSITELVSPPQVVLAPRTCCPETAQLGCEGGSCSCTVACQKCFWEQRRSLIFLQLK